MRTIIGLGGNALAPADADVAEQWRTVRETGEILAALVDAGHELVLTHGNGPQVGELLLQQEECGTTSHGLDGLVAATQGQIGYMVQQAVDDATPQGRRVLSVVTQTVVDGDDPAFDDPTKPVGPRYSADEADEKPFTVTEVADGTYRRVVPSPDPQRIVEADEIQDMVDAGHLVVCAGGGGIPVVEDDGLRGVDAVVDKDRAAAMVARDVDADLLVLATDVPYAYRGYGTDDEEAIEAATPDELRALVEDGAFGEGSMQPKVEACIQFIEEGGERAVITAVDRVAEAAAGDAGTQVAP